MPSYAIITKDKAGTSEIRARFQDGHKRYLDANREHILAAGAMLDDDGTSAHGGVLLVEFESKEDVEAFVHSDPFCDAGVFGEITITRWRKAFFDREQLL